MSDDRLLQLVATIFKEVEMNQQNTDIRFCFYQILGCFLRQRLPQLQTMRSEFVHGFVRLIEGEKDPRCLLVIFQLHQLVCQHFELEPFVEEMFEVVCCYFPISYNPVRCFQHDYLNTTHYNFCFD